MRSFFIANVHGGFLWYAGCCTLLKPHIYELKTIAVSAICIMCRLADEVPVLAQCYMSSSCTRIRRKRFPYMLVNGEYTFWVTWCCMRLRPVVCSPQRCAPLLWTARFREMTVRILRRGMCARPYLYTHLCKCCAFSEFLRLLLTPVSCIVNM